MQHHEIQARLAEIKDLCGSREASVSMIIRPDRAGINIYPGGYSHPSICLLQSDTVNGTISELLALAKERVCDGGPAIIEAMALDIINLHFRNGSVSWADLRHKHGHAVAKYALHAVAIANERMCPQRPIALTGDAPAEAA